MARDHARINLSIWQDDDFRELPPPAQHLYFLLWTHPDLNYAGVVDWRPGRLAALASPWSRNHVQAAADCLEARLFIVRDDDTEECLIRSWVRFDGLTKSPQMAVSFANAYAATASAEIRGVLVHEARKLRNLEPENIGWSKRQVQEMLDKKALDPRSRTLPADPLAGSVGGALGGAVAPGLGGAVAPGLGGNRPPRVSTPSSTPSTPAPAPAPLLLLPSSEPQSIITGSAGDGEFEEFWQHYPRRVGKDDARRAFVKAAKRVGAGVVIDAAKRLASDPNLPSDKRYIPHPATWLNRGGWDDEPLPAQDPGRTQLRAVNDQTWMS